jgi:WD40 repeat protein
MIVDNVLEDAINDLILQYENLGGGHIIDSNYFDNKLVIEFENFNCLNKVIRYGDVIFNGKNYNGERYIKLDNSIRIKSKSLYKIGYLKSGDQIIMSDKDGSSLIELDTTKPPYIHKEETMNSPYSICVSDDQQIFVVEFNGEIVHQFNSGFKLIKKIDLENHELTKIECISVDSDHIYGGKLTNNKIIKWDINTGKLIKFVENIDSPYSLALDRNNSLFVASLTKSNERSVITSGSNCIFVLNKNDLKPLKRIEFNDWLSPVGLFIDNDSNILTTAYRLLNGGKMKSKNRYIFKINKDGNKIKDRIQLEDVSACQSISIYDKRLFATYNNTNNNANSIKIIYF